MGLLGLGWGSVKVPRVAATISERSGGADERHPLDAVRTPLHPAARETLLAALDAGWADPRRLHREGRRARQLLDTAREVVAAALGAAPAEVSFHAGGREVVRLGLAGLRHARRRVGEQVVTSAADQSVVLDAAHPHPPVGVDHLGRLDLEAWAPALTAPGVAAAAMHHGNPEVATLQPVEQAYAACQAARVPLLLDATASVGRVATPPTWDVLAADASAWAGPAGVGVLAVRTGTRWALPGPRLGAEHRRTADDPWVPGVLAAAEALRQVEATREVETASAHALVERIRRAAAQVERVDVVGDPLDRLPHVVTFSVLYADGESLVRSLDRRGLAVASGSACTSERLEPSHVLAAMGALTHGNVRVTLPLQAVSPDRERGVEALCAALPEVVAEVRAELGSAGL